MAENDRTGVPREIPQLTGPKVLKENCAGANRICVLVGLPHILDSGAAGRNKYKETVDAVAKRFRGTPFSFVWFEGTSQPVLEEAFELSFGFPAVAALAMDKKLYAVQRGAFTADKIGAFLTGVTTGKQRTAKLDKIPTVTKVEPWDGKDGQPIEEESLADIMGEDMDEEL